MVKKIVGAIIVALLLCATVTASADLYAQHGIIWQKSRDCTTILTRDGNFWEVDNVAWRHVGDKVFVVFWDLETDTIEDDTVIEVFDE